MTTITQNPQKINDFVSVRTLANPNAIPRDLWLHRQFVCWKYVDRGKPKPDKIPVNCKTLRNGGVTWPNTWTDIRTAVATYQAHDDLAGMAYVLTDHDPHVMVDIDNCLLDGALSPFAADIVDRLDTYWERSPSGRGLRGFVHCKQQPEALKRTEIEIYSKERFATLTGNVLHNRPIAHVDTLDWLIGQFREQAEPQRTHVSSSRGATVSQDDQGLWERMFAFNSLAKPLFDGDVTAARGDPSRAVILLLNSLAKWTNGDASRMRTMIEQTALDKTKWTQRRGAVTWIEYQINDAINFMGGR